jgi:hypothetical protein
MSLVNGAEKSADELIAKTFAAFTPKRDMKVVYHYVDKQDVADAGSKSGNSGATPNGFVDYKKKPMEVYIDRDTKTNGTVEHETMHLYGIGLMGFYGAGKDGMSHVFEGVTEYFTRKIVIGRKDYEGEVGAITKLVEVFGESNLSMMFFQSKSGLIIDCLGQKVYQQWKDAVNAKQYSDAEKLIKGKKCADAKK